MKTINWGIIGAGNVAEKKSGPAFYKIEHSALVAVMRRDEAKAKDYAARHNVARYYTDAKSLINDKEVNAIYVATPPDSHKAYAIRALRAGKPVYVEKPMAMNYAECMEMVQAAEKYEQRLFVAYYRRALPYFRKVKEWIEENAIGRVLTVDVQYLRPPLASDLAPENHTWRINPSVAGEGYFYDLAPHTLDILDFLLGEIEEAKGFSRNLGHLYDVKDTIGATWQFRSGVIGSGSWCFVTSDNTRKDSITIVGTHGEVHFNTFSFEPLHLISKGNREEFAITPPEHIQQPLIQTIVSELRGEGVCPSTGITGARTSKVMDMIFDRLYL